MLLIPKQFSGLSHLSFFVGTWFLWDKGSNMTYICLINGPSLSSSQLIQHIHQVHLIPNIKHLLKQTVENLHIYWVLWQCFQVLISYRTTPNGSKESSPLKQVKFQSKWIPFATSATSINAKGSSGEPKIFRPKADAKHLRNLNVYVINLDFKKKNIVKINKCIQKITPLNLVNKNHVGSLTVYYNSWWYSYHPVTTNK